MYVCCTAPPISTTTTWCTMIIHEFKFGMWMLKTSLKLTSPWEWPFIWWGHPRCQEVCSCVFAINILVTEANCTPFNVERPEVFSKIFWLDIWPARVGQWTCKGIKLNNRIAPWRSIWRKQKTAPFKRVQPRLFSAIIFLRYCAGHWNSWFWIILS